MRLLFLLLLHLTEFCQGPNPVVLSHSASHCAMHSWRAHHDRECQKSQLALQGRASTGDGQGVEEGAAPSRDPEALKRLNYRVHAWVFCRSTPEGALALMQVPEQVPCSPPGPGPRAEDTGDEGHTGELVAERKERQQRRGA